MSVPLMICLLSAFSVIWIGVIVLFFFKRQASDFRQVMTFLKTTCKNIEQMARMTYLAQKEASSMVLSSQLSFFTKDLEERLQRTVQQTGLFEPPFDLRDFERALHDDDFVRNLYALMIEHPSLKSGFKDFMGQYERVNELITTHDTTRLFHSYFDTTPVKPVYDVLHEMMDGLYMPEVKEFFKGFNPTKVPKSTMEKDEERRVPRKPKNKREETSVPQYTGEEDDDGNVSFSGDVPPIDWAKTKKEPIGKYKK